MYTCIYKNIEKQRGPEKMHIREEIKGNENNIYQWKSYGKTHFHFLLIPTEII